MKFISRDELIAVTGLLPGGANGQLKTETGGVKFTHATDSNELFAQQRTPYVYPLLKAHKIPLTDLRNIKPEEVHTKIPARLVVGMGSCQMSRIQSWIEHLLTPFSKEYGVFEYTKDSSCVLEEIASLNETVMNEHWDLNKATLFTVDVKALYPSVKLPFLKIALTSSFKKWTDWNDTVITILVKIIMYTLEHQQISWNGQYYLLNQGIPTGAKHCVPLANIFLSFIIRESLDKDKIFKKIFESNIKIWKRFIDDIFGLFMGRTKLFDRFYLKLKRQFQKYGLELVMERSRERCVILDIEAYINNNQIHTRESRKETASNLYLRSGSAHPNYTFKGIVKSQMQRLRRLCSKDDDYKTSINQLKVRCYNSGYEKTMVDDILAEAQSLTRDFRSKPRVEETVNKIRWVVLAGSTFEKEQTEFVRNINRALKQQYIAFEIIKTTGPTIGSQLFNNFDKSSLKNVDCNASCFVCKNGARGDPEWVVSSVSKKKYHINPSINCKNSGIYGITCKCIDQYAGKTTVTNCVRFKEHWSKNTSVRTHLRSCPSNPTAKDVKVQFLENVWDRGKYSLSEREYLWNKRLKGNINIQKTISK